ncbi:MAG: ABC transporter ATP-binding protein [Eubacterium sp.]
MKQRTKYSVWENSKYMLKSVWDNDKLSMPLMAMHSLSSIGTTLMSALLLKMLLGILEDGGELKEIFISVGIFCALSALFMVLKSVLDTRMEIRAFNLRSVYEEKILKQSMAVSYENIESREKRRLLEKAQTFVESSNRGAQTIIFKFAKLFMDFLGVFSACALFLYVDFRMALLLLVVGICTYFVYSNIADEDKAFHNERIPNEKKVTYLTLGKPTEIKAAKDIRLFNISSWFSPLLDILMGDRADIVKRCFKVYTKNRLAEMLLVLVREGATLYFLISNVLNGKISVSDFAFYFGLLNAFSIWMRGMALDLADIKILSLGCDDYRIFVEQEIPQDNKKPSVPIDLSKPCTVEFKNVSFSYDKKKTVISNISFCVNSGEKIALVGENGAGKTTCMKLLTGLYSPDGGEILINSVNTSDMPLSQQFSLFSAVFQDAFYIAAGIDENISLSTEPDATRINDVIKKAGLTDKIGNLEKGVKTPLEKELMKDGVDLSGGEKQKLFLARALYKDAPIIILDEPTSALDPIAENDLYIKFNELTENKTSFYISHRLSSTRFCDRILYLKNGKITECGTHEELMAMKGDYFRMYEMQSYYYKEEKIYDF